MAHAGLMIAAAGDDAIAALDAQRAVYAPGLRFHRHGHKVSFAVIATDHSPRPELRTSIPLLAALDSSLWDQNGCLSAQVHFVEGDADGYAENLSGAMRNLASAVPRGTTPRRFIHRAFDVYKALEDAAPALCRVRSTYNDDFALIVDRRPWDADAFRACGQRLYGPGDHRPAGGRCARSAALSPMAATPQPPILQCSD